MERDINILCTFLILHNGIRSYSLKLKQYKIEVFIYYIKS